MLGAAGLALCSSLALAAPESLLPPGFDDPAPAPAAAPPPRPSAAAPVQVQRPSAPSTPSMPAFSAGEASGNVTLPEDFPTLEELEEMDTDEVDELFGLKPKFDIPAAARREVERVGLMDRAEGGLPVNSLAKQPASLVRAALAGTRGPLVSRWGHILLRRALASRLEPPAGMDPVEFAALRAALLVRIGEPQGARALVQDVDSSNYNEALTDAAFDAYLASADPVGMCPVARLKGDIRDDPLWQLTRSICAAFDGDGRRSQRELDRALGIGLAPAIDVLLAQRFAGAAAEGRRAVNIEWDGVTELTPWRFAMATALGITLPDSLSESGVPSYQLLLATAPAAPLVLRAAASDEAARAGVLSSAAMVDLYSQIYAAGSQGEPAARATQLREAYVAAEPEARLAAMRGLWGEGVPDYARQVLTAYAAARMPVSEGLAGEAGPLIASMLSAGLDRNAMRWAQAVPQGGLAWALLALAQPNRREPVDAGAVSDFIDDDSSEGQRKSRFLLAGLAGLGRLESNAVGGFSNQLGVDFTPRTRWMQAMAQAGEYGNPALVALLAGLGMQGDGWERMTPRHLYHIVRSLDRAGLSAEARMIAAEAVARG
jgi:hypothetical protein